MEGLRRHEVADHAAVSVTWYTWLEQGRDIRTTPQVVDALARALQLDADGHRYLRRLAGMPLTNPESEQPDADPSLVGMVDALLPHPAHLMEPVTNLLAWNAAYARLFVDPDELEREHRNGLWIQVMRPELQDRLDDWQTETEYAIARFRAVAARFPGDARFAGLIDALSEGSEFFRDTWKRHEVQAFSGHLETVQHPDVGPVRARLVQLRPLDHPNLLLMVHMLDDVESRARMAALLAG